MLLHFLAPAARISTSAVSSVGVTARGIAWPIVLVMCGALMILPFVFLVLVFRSDDVPSAADAPADNRATVEPSVVSTPAGARGK